MIGSQQLAPFISHQERFLFSGPSSSTTGFFPLSQKKRKGCREKKKKHLRCSNSKWNLPSSFFLSFPCCHPFRPPTDKRNDRIITPLSSFHSSFALRVEKEREKDNEFSREEENPFLKQGNKLRAIRHGRRKNPNILISTSLELGNPQLNVKLLVL